MWNNNGGWTPEKCEVDNCNQHVGQGGGQPHLHGDPFGPTCLYSASNYSALDAHPPQIGWANDGLYIYGRYLSANAPGFTTALDDCGGHIHDSYDYHYHTQVMSLVSTGSAPTFLTGSTFPAGTVGPHKCYKGDLSKDTMFNIGFGDSKNNACCGSTEYYAAPGILLNLVTCSAGKYASWTWPPQSSRAVVKPGALGDK